MKGYAIVVPAQERNPYHELGDLAPFGDVSLLEWKLSQVRNLRFDHTVYVSTSSQTIGQRARQMGVEVLPRRPGLSIREMISAVFDALEEQTLLWTYVTSPFLGQDAYERCVRRFEESRSEHDSLVTVLPHQEYMLYEGEPVNFDLRAHASRRDLKPVYSITNGCFIIDTSVGKSLASYLGERPLLFALDRLESLEIKDVLSLSIASDLLALYFRQLEQ